MATQINISKEQFQKICISAYAQAISAINEAVIEITESDSQADFSEIEIQVGDILFNALKVCGVELSKGEPEKGVERGYKTLLKEIETKFQLAEAQPEAEAEAIINNIAEKLQISSLAAAAVAAGAEAIEEFCINNMPSDVEISEDPIKGWKYIKNHNNDVDTLSVCLSALSYEAKKLNLKIKEFGAELLKTRTSMKWATKKLYELGIIK